MSEFRRSFFASLFAGGIAAVLIFSLNLSRFSEIETGAVLILHCLCDAAFVPSVFLLGVGGLKAIRNKGVFDVMGFGIKSTLQTFIPALKSGEKEDLYKYCERKEASRKPADGLLLAGAVYLGIAVLTLVIYAAVG